MPSTYTGPTAPEGASLLYKRLHYFSIEFLASMDKDLTFPAGFNYSRLEAVRTPDFLQSWGHNYMVSQNPQYSKPMTLAVLAKHLEEAIPELESWDNTISDIIVDEWTKRTVVRSSVWIQGKAKEGEPMKEMVEDDIVWILDFDETGEEVRRALEFKDEFAEHKVAETMK